MDKFKALFKDTIWLLFSRKGKINRKTFILSIICISLITFVILTIWRYLFILYYYNYGISGSGLNLFLIYNLPFFIGLYMSYSVSKKRFIDLEISGNILYLMILLLIKVEISDFFIISSINIFSVDIYTILAISLGTYIIYICSTRKSIQDKCKEPTCKVKFGNITFKKVLLLN